MSNEEDYAKNIDGSVELREQQVRGKGLFDMLAKGLQLNVISRDFINKYFQVDCVSVVPENYHLQQQEEQQGAQQQYEQQELLQPHLQQLLQLDQTQLEQTQQLFQQSLPLKQEQQCQLQLQQQQLPQQSCRKRRLSI